MEEESIDFYTEGWREQALGNPSNRCCWKGATSCQEIGDIKTIINFRIIFISHLFGTGYSSGNLLDTNSS